MDARSPICDMIRDAFQPCVAVLSSYAAEAVCQKNRISFCQLIAPFSETNAEGVIKEPSANNSINRPVRNLKVDFRDLRTSGFYLSNALPQLLSDVLHAASAKSDCLNEQREFYELGNYQFDYSTSLPWLQALRSNFFRYLEPSDHEFLKHYLACLFVVSTSDVDPLDQLAKLSQLQHAQQHQIGQQAAVEFVLKPPENVVGPKWFSPNIFKYHLLLHDVCAGSDEKAESIYQSMKLTYGAHACHVLRINSGAADSNHDVQDIWLPFLPVKHHQTPKRKDAPFASIETSIKDDSLFARHGPIVSQSGEPVSPSTLQPTEYRSEMIPHALSVSNLTIMDPVAVSVDSTAQIRHGSHLSASDIDRIKTFIQEFYLRGLLPFVERQMRILNDQMLSRRNLQKSFFSATKRLLGGGAAGVNPPTAPVAGTHAQQNTVVYTLESAELQVRRLADLAFMFQQYELAYNLYHTLKRDFAAEQAWIYFAGALEMAALCVFMLGPNASRPFPLHYTDTALATYINTCGKPWLAGRVCLLSAEILQSMDKHSEAADHCIRATWGDSDLCSGVFLERAAQCFLRLKLVRKFVLHLILAGHRFNKAGHRLHAFRCYRVAQNIYDARDWRLAEDHIRYTAGLQAGALGLRNEAIGGLEKLVTEESLQTAQQQLAFLRNYLQALKDCSVSPCESPLPLFELGKTKVYLGANSVNAAFTDSVYVDMERAARGLKDFSGLHADVLESPTTDNTSSSTPCGEPFFVEFTVDNPLHSPYLLTDVYLLWSFELADGTGTVSNEKVTLDQLDADLSSFVKTYPVAKVLVASESETKLAVCVVPCVRGKLHITGLAYMLSVPAAHMFMPITAEQTDGQLLLVDDDRAKIESDIAYQVKCRRFLQLRGRRLNGSKQERMAVLYGTDRRLQPSVGPALPLIQARIGPLPDLILSGQVVHTTLVLKVVGTQPVSDIELVSCRKDLVMATHSVDGSMCHLRICPQVGADQAFVYELTKNHLLAPGADFSCTVCFLAPSTVGDFTIPLLVLYKSGANSRSQRLCLSGHVMPSVSLACQQLGSVLKLCTSASCDVRLCKVACVGEEFSLKRVLGSSREVCLLNGESINLCMELGERRDAGVPLSVFEFAGFIGGSSVIFPWPHFSTETGVAVLWTTHITNAAGSTYVTGQRFCLLDRSSNVAQSVENPGALLQHSFDYHRLIEHDFATEAVCMVPVKLTLCNTSRESALSLCVQTNAFGSPAGRLSRCCPALWCGRSTSCLVLQPLSSECLTLLAFVPAPGTYDLSAISVHARLGQVSASRNSGVRARSVSGIIAEDALTAVPLTDAAHMSVTVKQSSCRVAASTTTSIEVAS